MLMNPSYSIPRTWKWGGPTPTSWVWSGVWPPFEPMEPSTSIDLEPRNKSSCSSGCRPIGVLYSPPLAAELGIFFPCLGDRFQRVRPGYVVKGSDGCLGHHLSSFTRCQMGG